MLNYLRVHSGRSDYLYQSGRIKVRLAGHSPRAGDDDYLVVGRRLAEAGAPIEDHYADAAVGPLAGWLEQ